MKMLIKKEFIVCIVIVVAIVIGDIFLQKYTKESLNLINEKLFYIKEDLKKEEELKKEEINKKVGEINKEWDKRFNILTCLLEHNELEKVKTQLVSITAGLEIDDKEYVYEELNKTIYILEHIRDKESFRIDNIF
ncbi:MAG: DUF4363 family protein [Clostridia bacterium]|nr:DUF4363 family protein [Clostridia bacterium]